jgi:hypothetical protein
MIDFSNDSAPGKQEQYSVATTFSVIRNLEQAFAGIGQAGAESGVTGGAETPV